MAQAAGASPLPHLRGSQDFGRIGFNVFQWKIIGSKAQVCSLSGWEGGLPPAALKLGASLLHHTAEWT